MSDDSKMLGIHTSPTCTADNGQPCGMCRWAQGVEDARGRAEWSLESQLDDYRRDHGDEALMERIEVFVTARGLY